LHQPQLKCGFVIVGHKGTIAYVVDKLRNNELVDGPLSPSVACIGQQIVDTAVLSAAQKRTDSLLK
jgi:glucose-fructose oxidoreductase